MLWKRRQQQRNEVNMEDILLMDGLKRLGLSEIEAKGYLALIERKTMSTSEIAKISNLNRTTAYDVVNNLMEKGLCSLIPGKIKMYRAAEIDQVAEQIAERNKKECQEANEQIIKAAGKIKEKLKKIYNQGNDTSPLDYIEVLKNPFQIHRRYLELFSKAQKEVLGFTKPPFAFTTKEQIKEQHEVQFGAFDRNVILRNVVQKPSDELVTVLFKNGLIYPEKAIEGRKRDRHAKFIDELPVKLFVFDEKSCFFALEDPIKTKTSLTMLVTEHEAMAKSFRLLFETVWEKSKDYFVFDNKKYYMYEPEEEDKGENE